MQHDSHSFNWKTLNTVPMFRVSTLWMCMCPSQKVKSTFAQTAPVGLSRLKLTFILSVPLHRYMGHFCASWSLTDICGKDQTPKYFFNFVFEQSSFFLRRWCMSLSMYRFFSSACRMLEALASQIRTEFHWKVFLFWNIYHFVCIIKCTICLSCVRPNTKRYHWQTQYLC